MAKKAKAAKKHGTQRSAGEADQIIGQRIRQLRVQLGLSQADLGVALGVSFQQIQKYERGVNRVGASRLMLIAETLKTTMDDLLGGMTNGDKAPENAYSAELYRMVQEWHELNSMHRASIRALIRSLIAAERLT
jgi:transcriptional regulator with XRE-family HTH domain